MLSFAVRERVLNGTVSLREYTVGLLARARSGDGRRELEQARERLYWFTPTYLRMGSPPHTRARVL